MVNTPFSLLIDESTDISFLKFLGITIMYFDIKKGKIISTYLKLVEMEACDAESIQKAICDTIENKGLDISKMVGLGSDNASVMVGINNGVYTKLKEKVPSLIHIPCVCHSLQLAVSAAASETLPRSIEFLIKETYNWFSHSSLRQAQYKNLYNAINDGHNPLKIVKACDTRWLSIETAVGRILSQWIELKTLFSIARQKEKCYSAEVLYNMYNDTNNLAYLTYIHPILLELQLVNKSFESNDADPSKLLNDLTLLVNSIAKRFVNPYCREDPLTCNMDSYTSSEIQWPCEFTHILQTSKSSEEDKKQLKERLINFLQILLKQLQQRLPKNIHILEKVSMISIKNALRIIKEPLTPLLELLKLDVRSIDKINFQWQNLTLIKWTEKSNTIKFWKEVAEYTDASGLKPYNEVTLIALRILSLPWSNGEVERLFSQMNVVKTKLRNRMGPKLLDSILSIRAGLKREGVCCSQYILPPEVLNLISKSYLTPIQENPQNDNDTNQDRFLTYNLDSPILF